MHSPAGQPRHPRFSLLVEIDFDDPKNMANSSVDCPLATSVVRLRIRFSFGFIYLSRYPSMSSSSVGWGFYGSRDRTDEPTYSLKESNIYYDGGIGVSKTNAQYTIVQHQQQQQQHVLFQLMSMAILHGA